MLMVVNMLKKLVVVVLVAMLVSPVVVASAATPAEKKLSVAQGKKIYDKAVKATSAWLAKTPHTKTLRIEDSTLPDRRVSTRSETIDRNNNMFFDEDGRKSFFIGDTLYSENTEDELSDSERAIAEDLGLNLDAKYLSMEPLLVNPDYPLNELRAVFRLWTGQSFTGERAGTKVTAVTYRKTGSTELLTVTLSYAAMNGQQAKGVFTTKIERGLITATTASETSAGDKYKLTTTLKAFSGAFIPPAGPYLDYTRIALDSRYGSDSDGKSSDAALQYYIREAKAYAAFEGVEKLTIAIWELLAKDVDDIVVYDKGFEFSYGPDNEKRACGVFSDEGADLELSTCADLGFTKL